MRPIEESRAIGALLGVAVGDALGWPMEDRAGRVGGTSNIVPRLEFEDWCRREGGGYGPHEQLVRSGSVSDDTQLTLAVARSLLRGEAWFDHFTGVELPVWTIYERGGGGATKRAAQNWLRGRPPWSPKERTENIRRYLGAGGNGAAMRCLPHCIWSPQGYENLVDRLDVDGLATHGHPRALVGSRVFAWAAQWALSRVEKLGYGELLERSIEAVAEWGAPPRIDAWQRELARRAEPEDAEALWLQVVDETVRLLRIGSDGLAKGAVAVDRQVLDRLGAFGKASGAGTVTAVASIFLASRYATQPQQGLLTAAFARGADTDTLAAMTGGLLGCLSGDQWLSPLTDGVQDASYVTDLASCLIKHEVTQSPPQEDVRFTTKSRTSLYRWLDDATCGDSAELVPFGKIRVTEITDFESRLQFIRSWGLATEVGQTLLCKRYDKGRDGVPRWRSTAVPNATKPATSAVGEMRAGLVLRVSDMSRTRLFYEDLVGLPVTRASDRYVSFGWLALEPRDQPQLPLDESPHGTAAIRIYVPPERLKLALRALEESGFPLATHKRDGKPVIRTADPDGHPVEFWLRNGTTPPVSE
jgi:ADP-ribosylglycohydrolase/catechol 2,3-dioxygenase-like lactoylglutathione lyase family enzyme